MRRAVRETASCSACSTIGARIGECLGLQIEDVHLLPDSKALGCAAAGPHFHVVRRVSNENDALGKSRRRTLPVIDEFIEDYRDYRYERSDRLPDVHSRFVFINYEGPARGAPMTYANAFKIITRLGKKVGVRAGPHRTCSATQRRPLGSRAAPRSSASRGMPSAARTNSENASSVNAARVNEAGSRLICSTPSSYAITEMC
jgi:integrase